MPARAIATVLLAAAQLAGCSGEDGDDAHVSGSTPCADDRGAGPYFLFEHHDWQFQDAIDHPDDPGPLEEVEPSLDWSAQYERFTPSAGGSSVEGVSLRLSGHDAALAEHQHELRGFEPDELEIDGAPALAGIGPDGAPTVVTMEIADGYTLMLLSYGLPLEELVDVAAAVDRVCQPAWREAGGRVLDCVPTEPGCAEDPPPATGPTSSAPSVPTTRGP